MARFYFHIQGNNFLEDEEGSEHSCVGAAMDMAKEHARSILSHEVRMGEFPIGETIELHDERRRFVARLPFKAAIRLPSRWAG